MKVEYDLYKSPPREVDGKEVVHLHARVARSKTISIWSLGDDIQKATSLTKSDLRAVLCEMSDRFVEELQKGNCVHIDGIGYFQMTLSCPGDVEKEGEVRAESIRFKSVVYKPEKAICGKLEGLKFIRSERGGHTKNYSDIELMGILSDYFKYNSHITRLELERVCGMTRSTAYRRIKSWMARNMLEKVVGIDAYRPVPGVFRVSC